MKITNTHTGPIELGFAMLRPGDCVEVPAEHEKAMQSNPLFRVGRLRVGEPTPAELQSPDAPPPAEGILSLPPADAIARVKACYRADTLREWAAAEGRPAVMSAIRDQMVAVAAKVPGA